MSTCGNLNDYIKKKDYKKIHKLLLKMNAQKPTFKNVINIEHFKIIEKKKELLKVIIKNDVQFMLINKKSISSELLMVVQLLDNDFNNEIRSIICNVIIKRALDDIQKGMKDSVTLKMIEHWISLYKSKIEEVKFKFLHLPPSWNLLGELTHNFCLFIRKYIITALQLRNSNTEISTRVRYHN